MRLVPHQHAPNNFISRLVAQLQAQSSRWLACVLFAMHMNVNTVNVTYKIIFFILSVVIWTPFELRLMAGAERLYHIFKWGRERMSYFRMGSQD